VPWASSRPPMPPVSGGVGGGRRVVVEASDGNRFAAFRASTEVVEAPDVVILPDVRGLLHPFYEELVVRFGDAGVRALALDYYGRTAGTGSRGGDFDHTPHLQQASDDNVGRDVAAAVAYLGEPDFNRVRR
jgi:carboxymethylenebutenolidase